MKKTAIVNEKLWAVLIGVIIPLAVLLAPSAKDNLAEHMFSKSFVLQIYIALLAVLFLVFNFKNTIAISKHPLALTFYATIILGLSSLFWSDNFGFSVVQFMKWITGLLCAFIVFQIKSKQHQRLILTLFFTGAVILALLGSIQYLFGIDIVQQAAKPASTFGNKNMAAQIVVLLWVIGVYLFMTTQRDNKLTLCLYAMGTALCLVFIFYTQTQAAWLSVIGQSFLLLLIAIVSKIKKTSLTVWSSNRKLAGILGILTLVILANVNQNGYKPFWEKIQQGADKITTRATLNSGEQASVRFLLWQQTIDMANEHPMTGVGLGNYYQHTQEYSNARTHTIRSTHNDYLQTIAELGYSVTILIVLSWILLGYSFFKTLIHHTREQLQKLFLIASLGGLAITALFSFPLQLQTPIIIISALTAILLSTNESKILLSSKPKSVLAIVATAIFIMIATFNIGWNSKLSEFNHKVATNKWTPKIDFDLGIANHPMFKWFSQRVSTEYMYKHPRSSLSVAESYLQLAPQDAVLLNTKIYSLIQLNRYQEAKELIKHTRELEPQGYYRSYYNEFILSSKENNNSHLVGLLDHLDTHDINLISMKPETLDNMAVAAYNSKNPNRAIAYLEQNIKIHPHFENSYSKLITMYNNTGNTDKSELYAKELEEIRIAKRTN